MLVVIFSLLLAQIAINTEGSLPEENTPIVVNTCRDFFSVWPSDCQEGRVILDERIRVISAQMIIMNSKFTLFTQGETDCYFPYENIRNVTFQKDELLVQYGFGPVMTKIISWDSRGLDGWTRISDLLRLILAHNTSMSYLDTDLHYLKLDKNLYTIPFTGVAVYQDKKASLEITNSAFCLPLNILNEMLEFQINRIAKGKDSFFYTELGPAMFQRVLLNKYKILLYTQNNPANPSYYDIVKDIKKYNHSFLHLTGHIRRGNLEFERSNKKGRNSNYFGTMVNTIRDLAGMPTLNISESSFASRKRRKPVNNNIPLLIPG